MADKSADVSGKEELSICARWLESGKAVEHVLGIIHAHEVNAEALTCYIFAHVSRNLFEYRKFDGSSTMSGKKSGVQVRIFQVLFLFTAAAIGYSMLKMSRMRSREFWGLCSPYGSHYITYAEAFGISKILCTYKFVACLYMLCNVLHTVAKLQGSLQSKELDLAIVPVMVDSTVSRLVELKENPLSSTWFKDHKAG